MRIRWITSQLGTAPYFSDDKQEDLFVLDVRDLVDKVGNSVDEIRKKIERGVQALQEGFRVVICCDYGISRSNAVAAGIIARFYQKSVEDSFDMVQEKTAEKQIKLEMISAVYQALGTQVKVKEKNKFKRILITGGSGLVGKILISTLKRHRTIISPTRNQIDLTLGNSNLGIISIKEDIDCIIHLANPRIYTSNQAMGESLTMLRNVIDVCIMREIPLIYPSSWEIYSGYSGCLTANEATPSFPRGPYGETKMISEILLKHFDQTSGLKYTVIRSSPIYGIGSDRPKFLFNFIEKAKDSKKIITHRYKNGDPGLDLLYIDDFIEAILAVIKIGYIGTLNVGTGVLTSTRQIAQMLLTKLNSSSHIEQIPINLDVASVAMDTSLAYREIGWRPSCTIDQGIDRILQNCHNEVYDKYE